MGFLRHLEVLPKARKAACNGSPCFGLKPRRLFLEELLPSRAPLRFVDGAKIRLVFVPTKFRLKKQPTFCPLGLFVSKTAYFLSITPNKQIDDLKENESKRKQRKEQIELLLKSRQSAEIDTYVVDESVRKGISELWFYKKIKEIIEPRGGEVSIYKKVMIFDYFYRQYDLESMSTKYYYPDIAIIIENLYIDVEIDEPYTMDSKLPIHCIGSDEYRNYYLASNGWVIIRFSEQQIVEHTDKCLETIKNTIDSILNGTYDNPVADPSGSWITNRWDETSAKNMMKNRFRESYLYDDMGNLKTL